MLKSPNILLPKNELNQKMMKSQEIFTHKQMPKLNYNYNYISNDKPISLYNSYLSTNDIETKDYSVNYISNTRDKFGSNKLFPISYNPIYINKTPISNQNIKYSYSSLCTNTSLSSIKSTESFISNNNTSQFNQNNSINLLLTSNNNNVLESPKKTPNISNFQINTNNNLYPIECKSSKELSNIIDNIIINSRNGLNIHKSYSKEIGEKIEQKNYRYDFTTYNNKSSSKINYFNTNLLEQNNKINDEKMNLSPLYNPKKKSFGYFEKLNNENNISERKKSKTYFNKFNSAKENSLNENTIILTIKLKVGKNDYRIFNLKKYDDLFVSLEKFVDLNQINQELVKPMVNKIFKTLNKIFWLLNNKIGIYDQEYLGSLYRLWIKNNQTIPRRKMKSPSDKSTNDSSDSSSEKSSHNIKSNSFQNTDENSDEKEAKRKVKTI